MVDKLVEDLTRFHREVVMPDLFAALVRHHREVVMPDLFTALVRHHREVVMPDFERVVHDAINGPVGSLRADLRTRCAALCQRLDRLIEEMQANRLRWVATGFFPDECAQVSEPGRGPKLSAG